MENRKIVEELAYNSVLSRAKYGIVHRDSPDSRDIDVALLYREDEFSPVSREFIAIKGEEGESLNTREILYVKGVAWD